MKSRGRFAVHARTSEGHKTCASFIDANVEMPILSVAQICEGGAEGSEAFFRKKDGFIQDRSTGLKSRFIKRKGVYFMKLYVPKDQQKANQGFVRPGNP